MHAYKTLLLLPRNCSSSYLFLFFFKAVKLYRQYGNEVETLIQDGKERKKLDHKLPFSSSYYSGLHGLEPYIIQFILLPP